MIKRFSGVLLALVILVSLIAVGSISVSAASELTISDDCMAILKKEEGFSKKPYWDYTQYTVGYGTKCPEDMRAHYTANGITEEEAEVLLRNHLVKVEKDLNSYADKHSLTLTQNQFDAMLLFSYNCGTGWCYDTSGTLYKAIANGTTGNELIRAFALWCNAGGEIKDYLLRRRLSEANMYLNGVYSQTPPEEYCYVLYNANGGVTSPRSQGYSTQWEATPYPVPTYTGYTFAGWYTAKSGGEKVTKLDASTKGKTLYAQWKDKDGNDLENNEPTVVVTVTDSDVNMRKGPGTNYTSIGKQAQKGEKLTIVETATGSPSRWGRFTEHGGGWICLQYTNYETALKEQENTQKPDATEPTEPETTEPEVTEPETTEPTEPETTEPEKEDPKPSTPKVMGTVTANEFLRIRKGPSTGYEEVGRLNTNARVEILEKKTVGATVWGRIDKGWISLDYVKLDGTSSGTESTGKTTMTVMTDQLNIRNNPGTSGTKVVGYLTYGAKVEVLETKTVGSTKWGRIDKGWVSMEYLKSASTGGNTSGGNTGSQTTTGTTGKIVNCSECVRIRSGAGTSYSIAGYYYPGDKVTITEQKTVGSTKWGKTNKGWVSMDYVQLDGTSSGTESTGKTTMTVVTDQLNIRNNPGTAGTTVVGYLTYGAKVEILETKTIGSTKWGRIDKGWISMAYVKSTDAGGNTSGGNTGSQPSGGSTGKIVNCSDCVRIRSGAGTSYTIVGYYYPGNKVTITEQKTVGVTKWGKTDKGWVSMDYVQLDGTSSGTESTGKTIMTITADQLNIRNNPGTSGTTIVGYLTYGAKVEVLETKTVGSTKWGRLANGWISLDYAK